VALLISIESFISYLLTGVREVDVPRRLVVRSVLCVTIILISSVILSPAIIFRKL